MSKKWYLILGVGIVAIISFLFLNQNKPEIEATVDLNKGAIVYKEDNSYSVLNLLGDEFNKTDLSNGILAYNISSKNYLYTNNDGNYFLHSFGKNVAFNISNITNVKFSPLGNYLFYFNKDKFLEPTVIDLKTNEKIVMENKCVISGQFIQWLDDTKLIYYGIDTERKVGGMYSYDVKAHIENEIYNIDMGYIEFIKDTANGVVLLEHKNNDNKILKFIDSSYNIKEITDKFTEIKDVISTDEGFFVFGKVDGNNSSLYKIENGIPKRVIYDFPQQIIFEKGLSVDATGRIYFIGSDGSNNNQSIYSFYQDTVTKMFTVDSDMNFIRIN